ncbi:hypothetical protein [Thermoactinomyces sp. DSM 45892]|uniref:hypothetical protein n=1 Tax=Thermoactinomyces sp. DSM 45892 TaxID=1882753 RepID=UPI00089BFDCF|nr:hypothetical protein [Thermoactinomyces sp. DSM 45892]SDX96299.1 hypothetical protein SAMN05444416_101114 [Thermoactinomyces sp. DSM 45892]
MKKILISTGILCVLLHTLTACQSITSQQTTKTDWASNPQINTPVKPPATESTIPTEAKIEEKKVEEKKKESSSIDSSTLMLGEMGFVEDIKVTDARKITQHINVDIFLFNKAHAGHAVQFILNQYYEFLQQKDIKGAKTVTIGIMQNDTRIFQITTQVKKFKPEEYFIPSILKASKIEKMSDEVREFGRVMEKW